MEEIKLFGGFILWANNWDTYDYEKADFIPREHVLTKYRNAAAEGTHSVLGWAANLDAHNRQALIDLIKHTTYMFI